MLHPGKGYRGGKGKGEGEVSHKTNRMNRTWMGMGGRQAQPLGRHATARSTSPTSPRRAMLHPHTRPPTHLTL
jgi:hypothetical protein